LKRLAYFIPPVLLFVVALHQIYLARSEQLSPWKGGGFGMFSSTELGAARYVRIFLSAPDRSEELQIPDSLLDAAQRSAALPSNSQLHNLAELVVRREEKHERFVDTVRIEVWRTRFDVQTLKPEAERIRDYVFKATEAGR
jgi:hypothetical protein